MRYDVQVDFVDESGKYHKQGSSYEVKDDSLYVQEQTARLVQYGVLVEPETKGK